MVNFTINGRQLSAPKGTTILAAAEKAGIPIPHLCFLKDINEIAACRMCMVEVEGTERLVPACNTEILEGMVIQTNSPRVREARKTNLRLILSQHNSNCTVCVRSGNCELQKLSHDMNIHYQPYEVQPERARLDLSVPIVREASKCVKCMRCVQVCDKIQGMHIWDVAGTGSRTTVDVSYNRYLKNTDCTFCGQCVTHCPTGALTVRDDTNKVFRALADPEVTVVVQVAPAVRAAWAESFGLPPRQATTGRMVAALKRIGFDYVFDTNFAADLTIMEEGSELVERIKEGKQGPMFTSCCPGWVRFLKLEYPDMVGELSTAKSPQQMFGAVVKSYYAQLLGVEPDKLFCISIMPCSAKKYECDVPEVNDAAEKDVDLVLTTRELGRLLQGVDVSSLPEEDFDQPLGTATGAGVIFGATGGVMEAALRSAHFLLTGKNPDADAFTEVRGLQGWKDASYQIGSIKLKVAVTSGLGNARKLLEALRAGEVHYDFVEVMACPGGCAGGGGQPICDGQELAGERGERLYALDKGNPMRFSHENPAVLALYKDFMEAPLSHKAHKFLHTDQSQWTL
nr:NADH-dependent [FeFe] hydrogenase, group A6 [uncultured Oscillibacter sp.]